MSTRPRKDEKTEDATPRKKREARKEGQVAKSPDVVAWAQILGVALVAPLVARHAATALRDMFVQCTELAASGDIGSATSALGLAARAGVVAVAPLLLGLLVLGVAANLAQTGFVLAWKKLQPKGKHLNPFAGIKRLFSPQNGWQTVKILLKMLVLAVVAWRTIASVPAELVGGHAAPTATRLVSVVGNASVRLLRDTAAVGLLLAGVDYAISRRRLRKELKMTKEEVKQEHKNTEGDPTLRSRLRAKQMELGRQRMLADVAGATAVVVNPTHIAVAIRYLPGSGAPRVVAKGSGHVATKIRELADDHGVPIVRDVILARTLHGTVEVGQEVPPDLYEAVARLIAFVMSAGNNSLGGVLQLR